METAFEKYAKEIDDVILGLPKYGEFIASGEYAETAYSGFTEKLEELIKCLNAGEVRVYPWTNMAVTVEFQPMRSPYFRLGEFGKSEIKLWYLAKKSNRKFRKMTYEEFEKILLNENLGGNISIGFDDDCDSDYPDDAMPDVVVSYFYDKGVHQFETDVNVFKCNNWRYAVAEFFEYNKESDTASIVNGNAYPEPTGKKPSPFMERTIQKSLPV